MNDEKIPDFREMDGGAASRKLWVTIFTQVLLLVGAILAAIMPAVAPLFTLLSGSLVTCLGLYIGGNVATRWVHSPDAPKEGSAP